LKTDQQLLKSNEELFTTSSTIICRNDLSKLMREKFDQLSFRVARSLCHLLVIPPQTKGVRKNLADIKAAIKQKLEQNSEKTITVI
jgi:hypothetical protein